MDVKQKAIVKQIISVIISLVIKKQPHTLNFAFALVDFILIAQYYLYNKKTLGYIEYILYKINVFKDFFCDQRPKDKITAKSYFDFFKFHKITYYPNNICNFRTTNRYDNAHAKHQYKTMLKQYYPMTNKRNNFQEQLLRYNKQCLNVLAMENILFYNYIKK